MYHLDPAISVNLLGDMRKENNESQFLPCHVKILNSRLLDANNCFLNGFIGISSLANEW